MIGTALPKYKGATENAMVLQLALTTTGTPLKFLNLLYQPHRFLKHFD
jgi:hypothetical protein